MGPDRCATCPVSGPCLGQRNPKLCRPRFRDFVLAQAPFPGFAAAEAFLAPQRGPDRGERPWEGSIRRKPWDYRITVGIVHLDTPDLLAAVLATLRAQTERPYLVVVDAGSHARSRLALEQMELDSDDLEVHYLRPKAWRFTSEPVAVGMDLVFARAATEYCYSTHTDVFLKRPDYLAWLLARCDARTPVVGYQMSPRDWQTDLWAICPSHTASLYHLPTMRRIGASWNMVRAREVLGLDPSTCWNGWPDTEVMLGLCLQRAGIGLRWAGEPDPGPGEPPSVLLLGPEPNEPYETGWFVHERSYTGQTLYAPDLLAGRQARVHERAREALERAETWLRRAGKPRRSLAEEVHLRRNRR